MKTSVHLVFGALLCGSLMALTACGGGNGGGGSSATYTVGGTVAGLTGSGLVLRDNGGDDLPISASGTFAFAMQVANGSAYAVTVSQQPTNPAQSCVVTNGNGTMGGNNVTDVAVDCTMTVSGTYIGVDYGLSGDDGSYGITPFDGAGNLTSTSVENDAGTVVSGIFDTGTYTVTVSAGGAIIMNNESVVSADGSAIVTADINVGDTAYIDFGVKQGQTHRTNADLTGTYEVVTYGNSGDSGSLWTLLADGSGNFTGSRVQNNAGVISPSSALTGTYAVAADGALTVSPTVGAPLMGGVGADGTLLLSQLTSGQSPSITVGIKQAQSGLTTADVSGTYAIATQSNSGDTGSLWAVIFDGAGNINGTGLRNSGGTISNITMTGTYSVAPDGALTVTPTGSKPLTGSISVDGEKLVLTSLNSGDSPNIWIGARSAMFNPWDY